MINPSEREDEVDHSFSDGDCGRGSKHEERKVEQVLKVSSPDSSKSLCLGHIKPEAVDHDQYQGESWTSSGLGDKQQDQDVDERSSLHSESTFKKKVVIHNPGKKNRLNYSFTNDEVRRQDRENYLLLQNLVRLSPGLRPEGVSRRKPHVASVSPVVHTSHSGLNRKREQQRTDRENQVLLKKLESAESTLGLTRSKQQHVGSHGLPASRMTSTGSKSVSQSPRTPITKTKETRPDWCS